MNLYPLKLNAVLKNIIWGGNRLANEYNKGEKNQKIAESWELSVRENDSNIIENGELAGKSLFELFKFNKSIVSENFKDEKFPLLIKFIDAEQDLSVQVHPTEEYAKLHENCEAKTEVWHILDCKNSAKIVYGLNDNYTKEQLKNAIKCGDFEKCLNYIEVEKGENYFIPAGLIHAIGAGILIAEIQQNSDSTFRIYDYNRVGIDGKTRELHIEQALETCIKIKSEKPLQNNENLIANCEYFNAKKLSLNKEIQNIKFEKCGCITCLSGFGEIIWNEKNYEIKKGESYFIPFGLEEISINGDIKIIVSNV